MLCRGRSYGQGHRCAFCSNTQQMTEFVKDYAAAVFAWLQIQEARSLSAYTVDTPLDEIFEFPKLWLFYDEVFMDRTNFQMQTRRSDVERVIGIGTPRSHREATWFGHTFCEDKTFGLLKHIPCPQCTSEGLPLPKCNYCGFETSSDHLISYATAEEIILASVASGIRIEKTKIWGLSWEEAMRRGVPHYQHDQSFGA